MTEQQSDPNDSQDGGTPDPGQEQDPRDARIAELEAQLNDAQSANAENRTTLASTLTALREHEAAGLPEEFAGLIEGSTPEAVKESAQRARQLYDAARNHAAQNGNGNSTGAPAVPAGGPAPGENIADLPPMEKIKRGLQQRAASQ